MPPNNKPSNLLKFHRPTLHLSDAPIPAPSAESKACLQTLAAHRAPLPPGVRFPRARCAAVLVALFVGRMGDLYVLLSRRSATLRTYAGDTSLPGGKVDPEDATIEDTARREAFEEIGLAQDRDKVPLLCVLPPFLAGNSLIVTPVVVLILDNTLTPILNAAEVDSLFSHPLAAFLTAAAPFPPDSASPAAEHHTARDVAWHALGRVRQHRFLTGREAGGIKPVFGLTAAILIHTAAVGYARAPDFEVEVPGGPTREERIAHSMLHDDAFRRAFADEGIDPNDRLWRAVLRRRVEQGGGLMKL